MKAIAGVCSVIMLLSMQVKAQDKITLVEVASGFTIPVGMAHAGDARLFILEKDGYIRIMDTTGQVMPDPFLDIDAKVNSAASERGLLGLAFHPNYAENGYFYVNYTNTQGNTVVARYSRDTTDFNQADPASEMILMTVVQPNTNHNGGHLAFGPDNYLYIGLGDGGGTGDPGDRAQNGQELLGKMLRIDIDGGMPYAIPLDNPFIDNDTILDEIWALGLRNPWRYCFDRLTGDLWIADVGQNAWEEVDFQPAGNPGGQNYGWRCKEGFEDYNTSGCPPADVFTEPVFAYAHTGALCSGSVTGGYVYRGTRNPYLYGKFIFTDYCTGIFRSVAFDGEGNIVAEELANLQNQQFTSFGEDVSGELYVTAANGSIYRVEDLVSAVQDQLERLDILRPNPATQSFSIISEEVAEFDVILYEISGSEIFHVQTRSDQEIDCSRIPAGIYLVEYGTKDLKKLAKLIILR